MVKHKEHTKRRGGRATSVPHKQLGFVRMGTVASMIPMISPVRPANQAKRTTHARLRLEKSGSAMTLREDATVTPDCEHEYTVSMLHGDGICQSVSVSFERPR